ncbi:MAG: threonine/serine dehydratase [Gemmatimonadales bacterium]
MSLADRIEAADRRIRPHARETPLLWSPALSERAGTRVFLKLENLQHTGSFKLRGALNRMLLLDDAERGRGIVTASTGNHGAACAYAGRMSGVSPTVFVPTGAAPSKVARIERLGGRVQYHGVDSGETEREARRQALARGQYFLSPYNDEEVMAGQGTIAAELLRQLPSIGAVVVAVGGGGLIGGIATLLKRNRPDAIVVGSSPRNSAVMAASVEAGRMLDLPSLPTLSDGTAGGVEADTVTFDPCRRHVDRYDLVGEDEIRDAMRLVYEAEGLIVEGAAGVALASALRLAPDLAGREVAVIVCGGNIGRDVWSEALETGLAPSPG